MAEELSLQRQLAETVDEEYETFKSNMLYGSVLDIFDSAYEIYAKTELHEFLVMETLADEYAEFLLRHKGEILYLLFDELSENENADIGRYGGVKDLIENYCEYELEYEREEAKRAARAAKNG